MKKYWPFLVIPFLATLAGCTQQSTEPLAKKAEAQPSVMPPPPEAKARMPMPTDMAGGVPMLASPVETSRDRYAEIASNPVQAVAVAPVSTFSIDVDTGGYANVRRFLKEGQLPPKDAVRVEEMINYFRYAYPASVNDSQSAPFAVTTALAPTPWNRDTLLLRVALRAAVPTAQRPPANLVFLLDTSGSMMGADRLPLLKTAMRLLVRQLRAEDRVAIVTYAGASGVVLPSTTGDRTGEILATLDNLAAGGSTHGSAGIRTAYDVAAQHLRPGAINRVVLGTDGDFNVGVTNTNELLDMITTQRQRGISLTALGFGRGNLNEAMMERLADAGDGNYAYIDSAQEAAKVLARQVDATLFTVAKDVKIQVEFNPARVAEYRLIGYENRLLRREDFNNDKVDAGEIGAGHTVTALYELTPIGTAGRLEPLRYQPQATTPANPSGEWAFVRLRYKQPTGDTSQLLEVPVSAPPTEADNEFRFAAAVAAFGQLLRGGQYTGAFNYSDTLALARGARGDDPHGERAELVSLIELAAALVPK